MQRRAESLNVMYSRICSVYCQLKLNERQVGGTVYGGRNVDQRRNRNCASCKLETSFTLLEFCFTYSYYAELKARKSSWPSAIMTMNVLSKLDTNTEKRNL